MDRCAARRPTTWPRSAPSARAAQGLRRSRRAPRPDRAAWDGRSSTSPAAGGWSRSRCPRRIAEADPRRTTSHRSSTSPPRPTCRSTGSSKGGRTTSAARSIRSARTRAVATSSTSSPTSPGSRTTTWGDDVEVVRLERRDRLGRGAQRRTEAVARAGSSWRWTARSRRPATSSVRSRPRSPIPPSASCGPFGIVTPDLREFDATRRARRLRRDRGLLHGVPARDPHRRRPVRREVPLVPHGRHRVLVPDQGSGAARGGRPRARCERHEHRMWFQTPPADRARWSKRNFYRFLDRWRDRYDLTVSGEPPPSTRPRSRAPRPSTSTARGP